MKRKAAVVAGMSMALLAAVIAITVNAGPVNVAEEAAQPALIGVMLHADWCPNCKALDPKVKAVRAEFPDVLFTRYDLTDEYTRRQSILFATWTGTDKALLVNQATGYMLLLEPKSGKEVGRLSMNMSEADIRGKLTEAVAKAKMMGDDKMGEM